MNRIIKTTDSFKLPTPFLIMHSVPLSAFEVTNAYPIHTLKQEINHSIVGDTNRSYTPMINAHGTIFQKINNYGSFVMGGHTQIFLNGIIEQVSNYAFTHSTTEEMDNGVPLNFFC
ncbi:hypothetical protein NST84_15670 [Paenibacillus sp. FSL R7-0345]|uniref:hypothetical protein n=1 Tax=Paenibacillus sp. FSL R7-0345 TaxID=2954535 RepID=UPI003159BDAD